MYITAQRVTRGEENGVNAYFYTHGDSAWPTAPPHPEKDCGELINSFYTVTPGDNPVHTYLDIVAPERTPIETLRKQFLRFPLIAFQTPSNPWAAIVDDCWFRLALTARYATPQAWRQEASLLFTACDVVYRAGVLLLP